MPLANVNSPRGFTLFGQSGKQQLNRITRAAAADRVGAKDLMVGDAYTVLTDGSIRRCTSASDDVHGIVEGIIFRQVSTTVLTESQTYIPGTTYGQVIGIEDRSAIFTCQIDTIAQADLDSAAVGALVDADGSQTLSQSRQSITLGGDNFVITLLTPLPANNSLGAFAQVLVKMLQSYTG